MKRKFVAVCITIAGLSVFATACGGKTDTVSQAEAEVQTEADDPAEEAKAETEAVAEPTAAESESSVEESGETEALSEGDVELDVENLSEEQNNMLAVMDSLNMCMKENDYSYDSSDPEFVWSALFYTIGNYPNVGNRDNSDLMEEDGETGIRKVYYKLVQEYITGLFEDYSELPDFPEEGIVQQDTDADYYDFQMGDRGISYGRIASWTEHADGTNTVVTELVDAEDDSVITAYRYVLVPNSYADGVTDPMFTYTVRSAEKIK